MAFEVAPISEEDYQIQWEGQAPSGVTVKWVPGSLRWVRVSTTLVLPRARVHISAPQASAVELRVAHARQMIPPTGGEAPVALFTARSFSPDHDSHELIVSSEGKLSRHRLRFRYSPRPGSPASQMRSRIFEDISCSSQRLKITGGDRIPADQWVYVGCRMVRSNGASHDIVPQLEIQIAWEGVSGKVQGPGISDPSHDPQGPSVLLANLLSVDSPKLRVSDSQGATIEIVAPLPKKLNTAFLGLGIGPYSYSIHVPGFEGVQNTVPLTTIYGSYFLTETSRFVFFDAFPIHKRWYNDLGLYFSSESSRALDEKLVVNLLLGFHFISFSSPTGVQHRLGAPQGFEMIYRDAFGRRNNVSVGGFFYPPIDGKKYYNTWLRVGSSRVFGEINYLSWTEKTDERGSAESRSIGVCVGAPLFFL